MRSIAGERSRSGVPVSRAHAIQKEDVREEMQTMRVTDLPLDTWVVIERLPGGECNLLSRHDTQCQAEAERDSRNQGLAAPRYSAVKSLAPAAGAQGCGAVLMQVRC
jgi:hypothetical protein